MRKVIVITGSSRGIGAATAILAAQQGYAVCVNYHRHPEAANRLVQTITDAGGVAIAVAANVAEEAEVNRLFQQVDQNLGPVTALVNNAAILEPQRRVDQIDAQRLHRVFGVKITGYFLCAREAIQRMSTRTGGAGGAIVNVSSVAAKLGAPGEYVDYAASKGAIDTFTVGLAQEVAAEGIRVNAVRPAYIYTDIHADGGEPDRVERIKPTIPMQRGGQPEEVAQAIMWLLSDQASYSTGTFIDVTGGR